MKQKTGAVKASAEQIVKEIRRSTRRQFPAQGKIRIVLEGFARRAVQMSYHPSKTGRKKALLSQLRELALQIWTAG